MELINKITILLSIVLFAQLNINSAAKIDFNDPVYEQYKKLLELARTNNISEVKKFIKQNVNLNSQDVLYKETALMIAASLGHLEITELLINNGADLNLKNADGDTALMQVAENGYFEVAKLLIQSGAKLNETNKYGNAALDKALRFGRGEIALLLIQSGANIDIVNSNKMNALDLMPHYNHGDDKLLGIEIAKAILISGKNIYNEGNFNYPLEAAAKRFNKELVQLLLFAGAEYKDTKERFGAFHCKEKDREAKEQIAKLFEDEEKRREKIVNKWSAIVNTSIHNNSNLAVDLIKNIIEYAHPIEYSSIGVIDLLILNSIIPQPIQRKSHSDNPKKDRDSYCPIS